MPIVRRGELARGLLPIRSEPSARRFIGAYRRYADRAPPFNYAANCSFERRYSREDARGRAAR